MMIYLASQDPREELSSGDVGNAFVEAALPPGEVVFVEQHPDIATAEYPADEWVLQLQKGLYGIPQAGRGFQRLFEKTMHGMGFKQLSTETCMFIKHDPVHGRILVGGYVDDLTCLTASTHLRDEWREGLRKAFKKVTFEDKMDYILGIAIDKGACAETGRPYIEMNHRVSLEKIAEKAGVTADSKAPHTPMDHSVQLRKKVQGEDDDSSYKPCFEYRSILGAIMYIANLTRPDLVTGVNKLARYVIDPSHAHHRALFRLVAYAYHTRDRCLRYTQRSSTVGDGPRGDGNGEGNPYCMQVACDSSFADCLDTRRSTIGRCIWMGTNGEGLIDWKSGIPKQVAQNTTEAELQAATECGKDVVYTRALLEDLGYKQHGSTKVFIDSNSCISQLNAVKGVVKARHYVVTLRKLQELKHVGVIHSQKVDTHDNLADMFTKALEPLGFWRLSSRAMGDGHLSHSFAKFRDLCAARELSGGRISDVKADLRSLRMSKEQTAANIYSCSGKQAKEERREQQQQNKQMQLTTQALCMALMSKLLNDPEVMCSLKRSLSDDKNPPD